MNLLPMLCDSDDINPEDALAHQHAEHDEEPLPHGARTRWFAMERQGFKDQQRELANENS
jgi:hypothetical protein